MRWFVHSFFVSIRGAVVNKKAKALRVHIAMRIDAIANEFEGKIVPEKYGTIIIPLLRTYHRQLITGNAEELRNAQNYFRLRTGGVHQSKEQMRENQEFRSALRELVNEINDVRQSDDEDLGVLARILDITMAACSIDANRMTLVGNARATFPELLMATVKAQDWTKRKNQSVPKFA